MPSLIYVIMASMNKPIVYLFDITDKKHRYQITKRLVLKYLKNNNMTESDLILITNDHDKPYFENLNIHFNISHSNDFWVLAISDEQIGVDIEHIRPCFEDKIAERFFHQDEAIFLKDDPLAFFKIWSMKESYVKYHGWGINENFSKFSVVSNNKLSKAIDNINLHLIDLDDHYALTLATKSNDYQLIDMRINLIELDQANLNDALYLIMEYVNFLNIDLTFQAIDDELDKLMVTYTPPKGYFLIAYIDEQAVGCVGIKPFDNDKCELKRLYVKDAYRNLNIAQCLIKSAIRQAKTMNYKTIYLDTLASLKAAVHLYDKMGFIRINAYYDNPLVNVIYFKKDL